MHEPTLNTLIRHVSLARWIVRVRCRVPSGLAGNPCMYLVPGGVPGVSRGTVAGIAAGTARASRAIVSRRVFCVDRPVPNVLYVVHYGKRLELVVTRGKAAAALIVGDP